MSYSASLTVGVPLADLYRTEVEIECVKRFDPKTGDPYLIDEKVRKHYWLDKPVTEDMVECYYSLAESIGLETLNNNSYDDFDDTIVGLIFSSTDDFENINIEELSKTLNKVKNIFAKHGVSVEPTVFLNLEVH